MRHWLATHWPLASIARWVRRIEAEHISAQAWADSSPSGYTDPTHPGDRSLPPIVTNLVPLGEDPRSHL